MKEEYINKFNFLNEYDVSKGGQLLEKQLVPAKLDDLKHAMEQDEELNIFLNTPAKDLPQHYRYLVDEISPDMENETLFTIIKLCFTKFGKVMVLPFFSMSGKEITGFVAYSVDNNEVSEIKMFSFNPSHGSAAVLIRDLDKLLSELITKYNKVSWLAMKVNPANRIYQKAIENYGGSINDEGDEIRYCIEKGKL